MVALSTAQVAALGSAQLQAMGTAQVAKIATDDLQASWLAATQTL